MLKISEGGLLFESFAPVPRNEPTRLWFSFDLRERIEALGEVAWTGEAGIVGGLKFLELTERARERTEQPEMKLGIAKTMCLPRLRQEAPLSWP